MQQSNLAAGTSRPLGGNSLPPAATEGSFVINLSASTTPVALTQITHPELKRFTFFVSRRREDGRERFRLHMGYFRTQEDAEKLLEVVREIYPAAWAGLAPGQRLRNAENKPAPVVARPVVIETEAPPEPVAPVLAVQPPAQPIVVTPPVAARPVEAKPVAVNPVVSKPVETKPAEAKATSVAPKDAGAAQSLSSVRAAIASLDEQAAKPAVAKPVAAPAKATPVQPPASRPMPEPQAVPTLSDSQVLRMLEAPRLPPANPAVATKPRNELTMFAVQLLWSVQPIEMGQVPQLAIFNAYTLYGAEGNRDGRRWYGLRLGFFTDAMSAKQVAQYVRSEFTAVSVVPVTIRERERALSAAQQTTVTTTTKVLRAPGISGQFKLLDDARATATAPVTTPEPTQKPAAKTDAGKPAAPKKATGKRVKVRPGTAKKSATNGKTRKDSLSLEETLEILGASELQIDEGRGELLNDSGVRHLKLEATKSPAGSALGRLIGRLAERLGD